MSSTLGKRKERDDDTAPITAAAAPIHGSTLFVSNLPYTATSIDLQTLFSDIAPVRSAFVVTEHGTGVSKGVGYVSFAIKEDAQSAFDSIIKDGITLAGRKLRIQWAESKKKDKGDEGKVKEPKPRPLPTKLPHPKVPNDPLAIRTVVVSGLPPSIHAKVLWKKFRKYEGAEKVEWPAKTPSGVEDSGIAHILFTTPSSAADAITKLHAHVFKGNLLSVTLKRRLDTLAKPSGTSKLRDQSGVEVPAKSETAVPNRSSRLIVRNLPFDATEQDIRAVFLPYGPIHSVHIPVDDEVKGGGEGETEKEDSISHKKPRGKGFAFVWMLSRKDAERAVEGCNGIAVRAGAAERIVSDKQKRKKQKRLEGKAAVTMDGEEVEGKENGETNATERVIAVDWALSKERWKEEQKKFEEVELEGHGDNDEEMESVQDESGSESEGESREMDSNLGLHEDDGDSDFENESSDGDDYDDEERDEDDEDTPVKPTLPPPETGTTLFVRNVPFNATEDELRALFRAFGPLRYARITMDHETGRSRGTGFVCFWKVEDADRAIEQCELMRTETRGTGESNQEKKKKNPFAMPSLLTPDPSSTLAQSLVLHGRTLDVVRAVTREEAERLREEGERARKKEDKRNIYLLREGVIFPSSPEAAKLGELEVEKRMKAYDARRALLRKNPGLHVSKTRLSVRQIPVWVTEGMVRRLVGHAVKEFKREVAVEERVDVEIEEEGVAGGEKVKGKVKGKKRYAGGVKQVKIVRQTERVDPLTGKGRSKGYGFVEMEEHRDALRVLRWVNGNFQVGELWNTWWMDEVRWMVKKLEGHLKAKVNGEEGGEDEKERERDEARLVRLRKELEGEEGRRRKGSGKSTVIVEFSIENVQVVQKRNAAVKERRERTEKEKPQRKEMLDKRRARKEDVESENSAKRRRIEKEEEVKDDLEKTVKKNANPIGAIIGRKRKERKSGKKGK